MREEKPGIRTLMVQHSVPALESVWSRLARSPAVLCVGLAVAELLTLKGTRSD